VELEVASFKLRSYHGHRRDLRVVEGMPGVLMRGVRLVRVHVNQRYFGNYCSALGREVTQAESCGAGCCNCGCYISLEQQDNLCRGWDDPLIGYKSKKGIVYSPHCVGMATMRHAVLGIPP